MRKWKSSSIVLAVAATAALVGGTAAEAAPAPQGAAVFTADVRSPMSDAPGVSREEALAVSASSGCGRQCDSKDPATYVYKGRKCSEDAITVKSASLWTVHANLRYSPFCRTTWADGNLRDNLRNESYYTNGTWRTVTLAYGEQGNGPHWTAMLDDADLLNRACAEGPGGSICTEKY